MAADSQKNGKRNLEITGLENNECLEMIEKTDHKTFAGNKIFCRGISSMISPQKKQVTF